MMRILFFRKLVLPQFCSPFRSLVKKIFSEIYKNTVHPSFDVVSIYPKQTGP